MADMTFEEFGLFDLDMECDWTDFEFQSSESQSRSPSNASEKGKVVKSRSRTSGTNNIVVDALKHKQLMKRRHNHRKPINFKLYAFPSFDRSDALLFFPNSLARHLNTCDYTNMSKLFNTHLDRNCAINLNNHFRNIRSRDLLSFYELLNDIYPDHIACVYDTKVMENKITTTIYKKCTACKTIIESVARTAKDNMFVPIMCRYQAKNNHCIGRDVKPERVQEMDDVLQRHENVLVYMKINVVITVDDFTKKIIAMDFEPRIQSVRASDIVLDCYDGGTEW